MTPTNERALVRIYRSNRKQGMYLYVPKQDDLQKLPAPLLQQFGKPTLVMDLLLTRDRRLARVDAGRVLDELVAKGFYLQMPPAAEELMPDAHRVNTMPKNPGV